MDGLFHGKSKKIIHLFIGFSWIFHEINHPAGILLEVAAVCGSRCLHSKHKLLHGRKAYGSVSWRLQAPIKFQRH